MESYSTNAAVRSSYFRPVGIRHQQRRRAPARPRSRPVRVYSLGVSDSDCQADLDRSALSTRVQPKDRLMRYWPSKTPVSVRDLGLDWGPALSELGDAAIVTSAWQRLRGPCGYTVGTVLDAGRKTVTRISGGTAGVISVFRNTVTLSDGQVLDEDVTINTRA